MKELHKNTKKNIKKFLFDSIFDNQNLETLNNKESKKDLNSYQENKTKEPEILDCKKEDLQIHDEQKQPEENHTLQLLENIKESLNKIVNGEEQRQKEVHSFAVKLGQIALKKLLPYFIEKHGEQELKYIIEDTFSTLTDKETFFEISTHPTHHDVLKGYIKELPSKNRNFITLKADSKKPLYNVEMSWDNGGAIWKPENLLEKIDNCIKTYSKEGDKND
ncbi:MAG: hypothetical protein ACTSXG_01110 [Alphaproteobacteria bacterium]